MGEPKEKWPVRESKHRSANNIKLYLREIGCSGMDWVDLAQDRDRCKALVNTVINLQAPQKFLKFYSMYTTGFSFTELIITSVYIVIQGLGRAITPLNSFSACTLFEFRTGYQPFSLKISMIIFSSSEKFPWTVRLKIRPSSSCNSTFKMYSPIADVLK
jgi:hypothetical protein